MANPLERRVAKLEAANNDTRLRLVFLLDGESVNEARLRYKAEYPGIGNAPLVVLDDEDFAA
jgi:hypothetical protein